MLLVVAFNLRTPSMQLMARFACVALNKPIYDIRKLTGIQEKVASYRTEARNHDENSCLLRARSFANIWKPSKKICALWVSPHTISVNENIAMNIDRLNMEHEISRIFHCVVIFVKNKITFRVEVERGWKTVVHKSENGVQFKSL